MSQSDTRADIPSLVGRTRAFKFEAPVVSAHFLANTATFVLGEEALVIVEPESEPRRISIHAGAILSSTADGKRLLTGGDDGKVVATQTLLTPDRRVASAISVVQAANPIALSIGPPLGALLLPWIGIRQLFMVDGAACLVAALLVTLLMPEPEGRNASAPILANMRATVTTVWRRPVIRLNFLAWYLTRGAMGVVDTYLPVRIGELVPADPAPAIGLVLGAFGKLRPEKNRSMAFGLATAAGSFGQFLFSPLAGGLIERIGWQTTTVVFGIMMLADETVPLSSASKLAASMEWAAPRSSA